MTTQPETELYLPVKEFLQAQGYTVRGEVNQCDLVGVRGEDLVIVELKTTLNLELFLQGIKRQKLSDDVYLAVRAPRRVRGRFSALVHLCRRLGLGLLAVSLGRRESAVQVVCDPIPWTPRRNSKGRAALLGEFSARTGDHNTGGTTRRPLITAYREEALRLAAFLHKSGPVPVRTLREATGNPKAVSLLGQNVYGWFDRVSRGVYGLSPRGREALSTYADVVAKL